MNAMHESLKAFLVKKNFLNAADGALEGFPLVVESAYRSYAEHQLGERPPVMVPTCLEQVNPRILDSDEWMWLGDTREDLEESSVEEDLPEEEILGGTGAQEENKETLPVADPVPVSTPSVETGDLVPQEVLGGPAEGMLQDDGAGAVTPPSPETPPTEGAQEAPKVDEGTEESSDEEGEEGDDSEDGDDEDVDKE